MGFGMKRALATVIALVLSSAIAHGQTATTCSGPGRVRGLLVDDSSGAQLTGVAVSLRGTRCSSISDLRGTFAFDSVPVGTWAIDVHALGYRRNSGVGVSATAESTVTVTVRVQRENYIAGCLASPPCASRLESPGTHDSSDQGLREAALRVIATLSSGDRRDVALCLEHPRDPYWVRLQPSFTILPASQCRTVGTGLNWSVEVSDTHQPAVYLTLESIARAHGVRARVAGSYSAAALDGAGWECEYAFREGAWRVTWCNIAWIR